MFPITITPTPKTIGEALDSLVRDSQTLGTDNPVSHDLRDITYDSNPIRSEADPIPDKGLQRAQIADLMHDTFACHRRALSVRHLLDECSHYFQFVGELVSLGQSGVDCLDEVKKLCKKIDSNGLSAAAAAKIAYPDALFNIRIPHQIRVQAQLWTGRAIDCVSVSRVTLSVTAMIRAFCDVIEHAGNAARLRRFERDTQAEKEDALARDALKICRENSGKARLGCSLYSGTRLSFNPFELDVDDILASIRMDMNIWERHAHVFTLDYDFAAKALRLEVNPWWLAGHEGRTSIGGEPVQKW